MLGVYFLFGGWLRANKKGVLLVCVLAVIAAGVGVVGYGLDHGRLPGGNSMLVRWQYWSASVAMYADHPAGVGGGKLREFLSAL